MSPLVDICRVNWSAKIVRAITTQAHPWPMAPTALRCKTGLAYFEPSQHKGEKIWNYTTPYVLWNQFLTQRLFSFLKRVGRRVATLTLRSIYYAWKMWALNGQWFHIQKNETYLKYKREKKILGVIKIYHLISTANSALFEWNWVWLVVLVSW